MIPSRMASRKVSAKPGSLRHSLFCLRDSFSKSHCFTWTFPWAEFVEGPRDGKWVRASFPVRLKGNRKSSELWKMAVMEEKRWSEGRIFRKLLVRVLYQLRRLINTDWLDLVSHFHHTPRQSSRLTLSRERRNVCCRQQPRVGSSLDSMKRTSLHPCNFVSFTVYSLSHTEICVTLVLQVTVCHSSVLTHKALTTSLRVLCALVPCH